jgi:hypothetical protein
MIRNGPNTNAYYWAAYILVQSMELLNDTSGEQYTIFTLSR